MNQSETLPSSSITEAQEPKPGAEPDGPAAGRPDEDATATAKGGGAVPYRPPYWFLFVVAFVTTVTDLATKVWAAANLDRVEAYLHPFTLIPGHLDFMLAKNRGGAWGLLQDTSEAIRRPFFLLVSLGAIGFIVTLYRRLGPRQWALRWGLPLVLGGALGNLVDRIRYSYVIDFIHMHARWGGADHHWPTYNVADITICVGVGLMALDMLRTGPKDGGKRDAA